jgi:hypothetical protein
LKVPTRQHVFGTTSSLVGSFGTTTSKAFIPVSWYENQDGSKKNLLIVKVNPEHAESNCGFIQVQSVEGMEEGTISQNGYHISCSVPPQDSKLWSAYVPRGYSHLFTNRVVLLKGPSRDFWHRDPERFHTANPNCLASKKAHISTHNLIERNSSRQLHSFLLVFPPGNVLNNQALSNEGDVVPLRRQPIKHAGNSNNNSFNKDIYGMCLVWRIAIEGEKKIGLAAADADDDNSRFFS